VIDIGVNLLHPQFDQDRCAVIDRARAAGVTGLLVTATDLAMSERAVTFCEARDLYCTAGETGLDFNRNYSPPEVQRVVFHAQLRLASQSGLPVFVHDRDSAGEVHEALAGYMADLTGVVVHCFTGSAEDLDRYLRLGCHIGVTGWLNDERRGAGLRSLVDRIPLERLLIETDAPFLRPGDVPKEWLAQQAPAISRRRNEPALLPYIADRIAAIRQEDPETIRRVTADNARRLFRLPETF
jgi:TatD DNase family protein